MFVVNFNEEDVVCIKIIECMINYDVKVVEYFLKEKVVVILVLYDVFEFIYFVCIFEDINNLLYVLMFKIVCDEVILFYWCQVINVVKDFVMQYCDIFLFFCIYGQLVMFFILGKEMVNVVYWMECQFCQFNQVEIFGKINGVVGNYNVYIVVYLEVDWYQFSEEFVIFLGIQWNFYIIQIELYDYIVELFDCIVCFNIILIDFDCDVWGYIVLNYFKQKIIVGEIGFFIMLYKVNFIDFENLEGNFGLFNVVLYYLVNKLLVFCWQCDLIDLIVLCNLGVGIGYVFIVYQFILKGVSKLEVNCDYLFDELDYNWEVLVELIQIVMCCYGIEKLYEKLKELICGKCVDVEGMKQFIDSLVLLEVEKMCFKVMMLVNYIGCVVILVDEFK